MPEKPKPHAPKPAATDDVVRARRIMWTGWLDECADVQDAFVEGMLAQLPVSKR